MEEKLKNIFNKYSDNSCQSLNKSLNISDENITFFPSERVRRIKLKITGLFKKEKLPNLVSIVLIFLVVLVYFVYVSHFAVNIPYWDEYIVLGNWFDSYANQSFWGNIVHLFDQANEHRIFSYRVTVLIHYLIFGDVNFRHITLFGNLGMICLVYLIYKLNPFFKNNIFAFVPVVLLLFVPQREITDWGMVTISSIFHYSFVFASLAFLNKKGYLNFSLAVFLAIIATFSFGNGMFTFFVGFIILFLQRKKHVLPIALWSVFMIASVFLYFLHFNFSQGGLPKIDLFQQPVNFILYFLTLFGNLFSTFIKGELILYYILGFVVFAFFGFLVVKKWNVLKNNPLLFSYLVFLIITASSVTIARVAFGVGAATAPRYMLLPILFVVSVYILALLSYKTINKKIIFLILGSSMILYFSRISQQDSFLKQHRTNLIEGLVSYYNNPNKTTLGLNNQIYASNSLTNSIKKGVYNPPALPELSEKKIKVEDINIIPSTNDIVFCIDSIGADSVLFQIRGWAFLKNKNRNDQQIGITLNSLSDTLFFETSVVLRIDVVEYFKKKYNTVNNKCGFNFTLNWPAYKIPPGQYKVGIGIINDEKMITYRNTNQIVKLETK